MFSTKIAMFLERHSRNKTTQTNRHFSELVRSVSPEKENEIKTADRMGLLAENTKKTD